MTDATWMPGGTAGLTAPQPAAETGPGAGPGADPARAALGRLRAEVAKAVVGQDATVSGLVIALLCGGHVLLEGVPGVAKTLLVRTLAAALDLDAKRVLAGVDVAAGQAPAVRVDAGVAVA